MHHPDEDRFRQARSESTQFLASPSGVQCIQHLQTTKQQSFEACSCMFQVHHQVSQPQPTLSEITASQSERISIAYLLILYTECNGIVSIIEIRLAAPIVYRVKDNLTYSLDLHELKDGIWVPYKADEVQLEFVMLDPYVRTTLSHDDQGRFSVTFQVPDVYGIFLFPVLYRRLGLSTIFTTTQLSLRPFKHDEYERFIPGAYPYYASVFR
ncbi:hypothetical protein PsorP6_016753 [Peronosclerospora sorghi]|uniref:Uncharacterized protein n=1 Tax=Peronosclerospora sorghi TaxID=230839 RepID=A0ACC0WDH3_9STRA|nr:hypothetical protein PsorP6_016753 [Peronosclerospora sorghi]